MGLDPNYQKWVCDKCKTEEHIKQGDAREAAWGKFERIDANGVKTTNYYCPEHKSDYQGHVQEEDARFQAWLNGDDE